jgi:hypothetical protein
MVCPRLKLNWFRRRGIRLLFACALLAAAGCGQEKIKTLEPEWNGYFCTACQAKFYTSGKVFADFCPQCKSPNIVEAVGLLCPSGHVNVAPRSRGSMLCEKCGQRTTGMKLPTESDFQAWGASRKTKAEVSH